MKKQAQSKTNAMRILDQHNIDYSMDSYDYDEADLSGVHAAEMLGVEGDQVFKTLVTRSGPGPNDLFVFVIPSTSELDLKKAAQASGQKRIEMIHMKELVGLTGYIRGGCSPIGMKKLFPTYIDETAILFDRIYISAGKRGEQIIINPEDLCDVVSARLADLTRI